jgi:hypothetical protein
MGNLMRRLLAVLRDPVAWILVIAGVVELISGGTAARGAILFAGAALIMADRVRGALMRYRVNHRGAAGGTAVAVMTAPPYSPQPLKEAVESPGWMVATGAAIAVLSLFLVHSAPLTAAVGIVGVVAVGWAWLTHPHVEAIARPPLRGLLIWGGVLLALGLWEASALLLQPTMTEGSDLHPTISYLLDPVLATYPGKVVGLGLWALAGRALVRRA